MENTLISFPASEVPRVKPKRRTRMELGPMADLNRWTVWRPTQKPGTDKFEKIPCDPLTGRWASVKKPGTWSSYQRAYNTFESTRSWFGIQFVVGKGIVCLDLDNCWKAHWGFYPWVSEVIGTFQSTPTLIEYSPAKWGYDEGGIHIWGTVSKDPSSLFVGSGVRVKKPNGGELEIYWRNKAISFTGVPLWNFHSPSDITEPFFKLLKEIKKERGGDTKRKGEGKPPWSNSTSLCDEEILQKMFREKGGQKWVRLWKGDTSMYPYTGKKPKDKDDYSAADFALCRKLAFYCGPNPEKIDSLFRLSGLYRKKWNRTDYREGTIANAIKACKGVFYGGKKS